ncbi:DUF6446 family protein [Histidinibacterium lentulum]|uniref:Histidine kinase n=1 Tax=Histidinibacterium lentulum TaxID=2480588 RepID=A0A3N2QS31_9RHOB|nr:DUF6446 family protein [Histidinibacterium lentulum]ROT98021.1 histidine kinase [Histidinibacterium lentulum]
MTGRIAILVLLFSALVAGAGLYYLQVWHYYDELSAEDANVQLLAAGTGEPVPFMFENFKGIDADSSPIRYRACFDLTDPGVLGDAYEVAPAPEPLVAPRWFDCFDAGEIGRALEEGRAVAYLGASNDPYGVDRIVAVYPDGRAFAWTQLNRCGEVVFDGDPVPDGCPPPPEAYR